MSAELDYIVIPTSIPDVSILGKTDLSDEELFENLGKGIVLYDAQYIVATSVPKKDESGQVSGYAKQYRLTPICPFTGPIGEYSTILTSYAWLADDEQSYEGLIKELEKDEDDAEIEEVEETKAETEEIKA